jgi:hypothetical protein
MDMAHAAIVIIEPMDVERAGVAGTNLPALPSASRGRGAAGGRKFADRQCFTSVLNGGGGFNVGHGGGAPGEWWRVGPMSAGRQGRQFDDSGWA